MPTVRVKICGITRPEDAEVAVAAGADALGFMFYEPSRRCVSIESAAEMTRRLPPMVTKVGVFVDPDVELVHRAIEVAGVDTLQFHGRESPEFCRQFAPHMTIKAFRIRSPESLQELSRYQTHAWLLDSYVPGQAGGTGTRFNWELARRAREYNVPIILAGGLTPANVGEAIRLVRPYAVDVSSGVESTPGRKDPAAVHAFLQAALSQS